MRDLLFEVKWHLFHTVWLMVLKLPIMMGFGICGVSFSAWVILILQPLSRCVCCDPALSPALRAEPHGEFSASGSYVCLWSSSLVSSALVPCSSSVSVDVRSQQESQRCQDINQCQAFKNWAEGAHIQTWMFPNLGKVFHWCVSLYCNIAIVTN